MKNKDIYLRRLKDIDSDYRLLEKWYQDKKVYTSFEQRILSFDEIKIKYYPRTVEDSMIPVYMIEYKNIPLGIIQYKLVSEEDKKLYNIYDNDIYEIDLFIGEEEYRNKGIGRDSINLITNYLFNFGANIIVMCPLKDNISAIKCYLNCGFKEIKTFRTKDTIGNMKEYILMEMKR